MLSPSVFRETTTAGGRTVVINVDGQSWRVAAEREPLGSTQTQLLRAYEHWTTADVERGLHGDGPGQTAVVMVVVVGVVVVVVVMVGQGGLAAGCGLDTT
jgi:hypothetical protein